MKPYVTRKLTEGPDVADIRTEGRKSAVGRVAIINGKPNRFWRERNPNGDYRGYSKPAAKATMRRNMKRSDKAKVMKLLNME